MYVRRAEGRFDVESGALHLRHGGTFTGGSYDVAAGTTMAFIAAPGSARAEPGQVVVDAVASDR